MVLKALSSTEGVMLMLSMRIDGADSSQTVCQIPDVQ